VNLGGEALKSCQLLINLITILDYGPNDLMSKFKSQNFENKFLAIKEF